MSNYTNQPISSTQQQYPSSMNQNVRNMASNPVQNFQNFQNPPNPVQNFQNPPNPVQNPQHHQNPQNHQIPQHPPQPPPNAASIALTNGHTQLHNSILQLYQHILPRETDTGFPSQFTVQSFGNNVREQEVSLKKAAANIEVDVTMIQSNCDALKLASENYYLQYNAGAENAARERSGMEQNGDGMNGENDLGEFEIDEEQKLLRDILLLQKQLNVGTMTIKSQKERLILSQSMLGQVINEQEVGRKQTFG